MLTTGQVVAAAVVETGAGVVQGALGFGINTLAVPILVLVSTDFMPVPVLVASMVCAALVAWRERPWSGLGTLRWAIAGRLPGNVAGVAILATVRITVAALAMAFTVLVAVCASRLSVKLPRNRVTLFVAGVASGVMGTVAGLGGVPLGLIHQDSEGGALRRTMSAFVLVGGAFSLITLAIGGQLSRAEIGPTLVLVPGAILGFLISSRVLRFVDSRTRPAVLVLAAVASLGVIVTRLA